MKKGYLIAVDLDNTLVYDFDQIDQVSFNYLKELSKTNYIVIATGRPYRSSKYYYDLLDLDTPIINYNGAIIHHPKNNEFTTSEITINKDVVIDLIEENKQDVLNIFCEIGDNIYLYQETEEFIPFLHLDGGYLTVGDFRDTLLGNPNGAIALIKYGSEEIIENYIKDKFKNTVNIRFWHVGDVAVAEIYSPLTSKGNALEVVRRFYNIPKEKTIAIGDGHNDIEMISTAHIGVAMANSHPDLLKHANEVTSDIYNNGVYKYLKQFFEK